MVDGLGVQSLVDYICFDYATGLKIIEMDPDANVSYLSWKADVEPAKLVKDGFAGFDYHLNAYKEDPNYLERAKKYDLSSNVWTVNKREDMIWFLERDIDYIITDKPKVLLHIIDEVSKNRQ